MCGPLILSKGEIVCGNSRVFAGCNGVCQLANLADIPAAYIHPNTKQCNYSYVHPTTKQCTYTPDLSNYVTKSELSNFDIYSKSYTLLKQYDMIGRTFFDRRASTDLVSEFLTNIDVLPILPKRSHMLKITADPYTSTHTTNKSLHSNNNVFCAIATGGVGNAIGTQGGSSSISPQTLTLSSLRVEIIMSIIYIKETNTYYGATLRSLGQGYNSSSVSDNIAQTIVYNKILQLKYSIGAYTAAYSTQADVPTLTCTISGNPKFSIYTA